MQLSPELTIFFAAMLPFVELKLAIPLGLKLGLSTTNTFIFAVSGSILPAAISLASLGPVSEFCRKNSKNIDNILTGIFNKTRQEHSKNFARFEALFLVLFVAIPLPGSGTVSASIIAFIFGVDYWKSLSFIALGAATAGFLLTAGFGSAFSLLNHFNSPA